MQTPVNATLVACIKGIERACPAQKEKDDGEGSSEKAYLEHVAFRVKDIHWHLRFFREVLGMTHARSRWR